MFLEQGIDVAHGIAVKPCGLDERLPPARPIQVEVLAEFIHQDRRPATLSLHVEAPVHDQPLAERVHRADVHL